MMSKQSMTRAEQQCIESLTAVTIHKRFWGLMAQEGTVKFAKSETLLHKISKTVGAHYCQKIGLKFWTELKFINNMEADLLFVSPEGRAYVIEFESSPDRMTLRSKTNKFFYSEVDDVYVVDLKNQTVPQIEQSILEILNGNA